MKKRLLLSLVLLSSLLLTGCLGDLIEFSCWFFDDVDHCYQSAAVQKADPDSCENVGGEGFSGSNPPKDKCYLMIAENTGDRSVCDKVVGGPASYSQQDCLDAAARYQGDDEEEGSEDPEVASEDIDADLLVSVSEDLEAAKSEAGRNPDDKEAQRRLEELQEKERDLFDRAPESVRVDYFRRHREQIMSEVDDADVQSSIAKIFTDFRGENPDISLNDQIKKLEEIKQDQDTIKRLDDHANSLMDQIKSSATDFANQTVDDLYGGDIEAFEEAMKDKGIQYFEDHGGKDILAGIDRLESYKEAYDKASEHYQAVTEQVERLKAVYDEAKEVYAKVDEVNKMVAEGKIEPGHAKALHGAIYLGKGLEYATQYVPVFGSTISTISKETFDATVKFATRRAERTTALNKCIEDPENCDPSGISPY